VCLDNIIPVDFNGTVQCDGYSAYRAFANTRSGAIELAGCWAHVRRKFHEALEQSPKTAGWVMRQIQHLYRVEARLREQRAGPKLREAVRAHESRPIIQRLERAFIRLKSSGRFLPQSLLGVAIDYALGQWQTLDVYLEDGRVENRQQPGRKRHPAHGHWQKELALYGRCRCRRTWSGYQSVRPVLSRCADSVRIFADVSADSRLVDPPKCLMQAHQDLEARVGIEHKTGGKSRLHE